MSGTPSRNAICVCFQAAILQQTAEYIYTLEQEKTLLLSQNSQLKRLLSLNQQHQVRQDGTVSTASPAPPTANTVLTSVDSAASSTTATSSSPLPKKRRPLVVEQLPPKQPQQADSGKFSSDFVVF